MELNILATFVLSVQESVKLKNMTNFRNSENVPGKAMKYYDAWIMIDNNVHVAAKFTETQFAKKFLKKDKIKMMISRMMKANLLKKYLQIQK